MDSEEKRKAIKGTILAALVATPFIITANMQLPPETIRSLQQARETPKADHSATDDEYAPSSEETEAQKIADGTHCVGGWDLTFSPLIRAVKAQLRDPRSFEHVSTVWTKVGKDGRFGLIMEYRAQNG